MKVIRLICLSLLLLLTSGLTGCGVFNKTPPDKAVELAIAHQLSQTQQTLAHDLGLLTDKPTANLSQAGVPEFNVLVPNFPTPNFKIEKVNIQKREKVTASKPLPRDQNNRAYYNEVYSVKGTFEASLDDRYRAVEGPFEVRLGTDTASEGASEASMQTWYVIEP